MCFNSTISPHVYLETQAKIYLKTEVRKEASKPDSIQALNKVKNAEKACNTVRQDVQCSKHL